MEAQTIIFMRGPMGLIQDIWGGGANWETTQT